MKAHDFAAFFGCGACEDYYSSTNQHETAHMTLMAVIKTQAILFREGVFK
jgi:hypothetical protein